MHNDTATQELSASVEPGTEVQVLNPKPSFSEEAAIELLDRIWGLQCTEVSPLPSYDDQNMTMVTETAKLVFKAAASGAECRDRADEESTKLQLEMENQGMHAMVKGGLSAPLPVKALSGEEIVRVIHPNGGDGVREPVRVMMRLRAVAGQVNFIRVIQFMPGQVLAKVLLTQWMPQPA